MENTWNITFLFGGIIALAIMLFLFMLINAYVVEMKIEKKHKNSIDDFVVLQMFFYLIAAGVLLGLTVVSNMYAFVILLILQIVFIVYIIIKWNICYEMGYRQFFTYHMFCLAIVIVVLCYSIAISSDLNYQKNVKLAEEYEIEKVQYYEFVELKDGYIFAYLIDGDNRFAKNIPLNSIICELTKDGMEQAEPYIYQEKRIYEKLNYSTEPPAILEEKESVWSDFILCGSEDLIMQVMEQK